MEKYEAGKIRAIMILGYSKYNEIRENRLEFGTYRKQNAENEVDDASTLEYQDKIG